MNARDAFGRTSLVLAAAAGHLAAMQVLVDAGADVDIVGHVRGGIKADLKNEYILDKKLPDSVRSILEDVQTPNI